MIITKDAEKAFYKDTSMIKATTTKPQKTRTRRASKLIKGIYKQPTADVTHNKD